MSEDGPRRSAEERLSSEELERVIRRAAELQTVRETLPDRLDDAEVMRIGSEVGLREEYLRRALVEVRAENLVPGMPEDRGFTRTLWGEAFVQSSRVVPGDLDDVQTRLEEYLETAESLRPVRNRPGLTVWEPASDIVSVLRRGLDMGGRGYALARSKQVAVTIETLETGRCLVTATADLTNRRWEHGGGWYAGAGFSTVGLSIGAAVALGLTPFVAVPLAAGLTFGGGTALARHTLQSERAKVQLAMEGLLDRLERGGRMRIGRPRLVDRIQDMIAEADE